MPIRVQNDLPVKEILESENIFVMDEHRAMHQDIRPIKIGLLNLMPLNKMVRWEVPVSFQISSAGCQNHTHVNKSIACHMVLKEVF